MFPSFKLVLLGDGGVGKSSYMRRLLTGEFDRRYIATFPYHNNDIYFSTNCGVIKLSVWESAGAARSGSIRDSQQ
jgi:GTP-binding nuclear protein Ran